MTYWYTYDDDGIERTDTVDAESLDEARAKVVDRLEDTGCCLVEIGKQVDHEDDRACAADHAYDTARDDRLLRGDDR